MSDLFRRLYSENYKLYKRKLKAVELAANGHCSKEVGAALNMSARTVEAWYAELSLLLEAKNKAHLVAICLRKKLIE